MTDKTEAALLEEFHRTGDWEPMREYMWSLPPVCCVCGGEDTRPDDPWEVYSTSSSTGPDWMHKSCLEKALEKPQRPLVRKQNKNDF
jgi:hypothetical protein